MELSPRISASHRFRQRFTQMYKGRMGRLGVAAIAILCLKGMIWLLLAYWVL
jgi:hypothetical protein